MFPEVEHLEYADEPAKPWWWLSWRRRRTAPRRRSAGSVGVLPGTAPERLEPGAGEECSEICFVLYNDTALIPTLLARIETNAMLHGNLELSSALRDDDAAFNRLAEERANLTPYANRVVHVIARFSRQELTFVVRDEGNGFDTSTLADPTDPGKRRRTCGGLRLIRAVMDSVWHNDKGNQITMTRRL